MMNEWYEVNQGVVIQHELLALLPQWVAATMEKG